MKLKSIIERDKIFFVLTVIFFLIIISLHATKLFQNYFTGFGHLLRIIIYDIHHLIDKDNEEDKDDKESLFYILLLDLTHCCFPYYGAVAPPTLCYGFLHFSIRWVGNGRFPFQTSSAPHSLITQIRCRLFLPRSARIYAD